MITRTRPENDEREKVGNWVGETHGGHIAGTWNEIYYLFNFVTWNEKHKFGMKYGFFCSWFLLTCFLNKTENNIKKYKT